LKTVALKILLADDSMTAQNMAKKILADAGHDVTAVSNGAAAAKKLTEKFDLYILDIFMPGYSGLEICDKIRANIDTAKSPVLLTVGKMEPYKAEEGLKVKSDGIIIKPFEASDLLAAVQKIEKKLAPKPTPEEAEYERTMIFKAPQVQEFQDDTYAEWKETTSLDLQSEVKKAMAMAAEAGRAAQEETVQYTQPLISPQEGMSAAAASMPVGMDETLMAAPQPATGFDMSAPAGFDAHERSAPALDDPMMSTSAPAADLYEPPAIPGVDDIAQPSEVAAAHEDPTASLLEPTAQQETEYIAPAADPHIEFTSAPKAAGVQVEKLAEVEHDEDMVVEVPHVIDPALARHDEMHEFVTKIGVEQTEEEEAAAAAALADGAAAAAETAPVSAEDAEFERLLAARMQGLETESAPASEPEPDATQAYSISPVEVETTHSYSVSPVEEISDAPQMETSASQYSSEPESHSPDPMLETSVHADTAEPLVEEPAGDPAAPPEGMVDAALVEEFHAAVVEMPVAEHAVEEPPIAEPPVAEPQAAMAATASAGGPDPELAAQLAAAVGAEMPPAVPTLGGMDADTITRAVNKVLEKMLPVLLNEVAREIEGNRK